MIYKQSKNIEIKPYYSVIMIAQLHAISLNSSLGLFLGSINWEYDPNYMVKNEGRSISHCIT